MDTERSEKDRKRVVAWSWGPIVVTHELEKESVGRGPWDGSCGINQMEQNVASWWHPHTREIIKDFVKNCKLCTLYNPRATLKPQQGKFPSAITPGREMVIDYTDMVQPIKGYRYLLVCVDAFTDWPEACPAKKEDSKTVIKFLINQYMPRHGFPKKVRSDNRTHFKNADLQQVEKALGLKRVWDSLPSPIPWQS